MSVQLASFPNSRVKPRPVTTTSTTNIVTIPAGPGVTLLLPADSNRVTVLIRNLDSTKLLYYGYVNTINDTPGTGGFEMSPGQSFSLDDPGNIYIFNPNASTVNMCYDQGEG